MSAKRVLIITYYWPPSGGSGVQRWLKFVKYLCRRGWEPIVFTPENPSFTIADPSLEKDVPAAAEVIRLPIWEPYRLFFRMLRGLGRKPMAQSDFISTGRQNGLSYVSAWLRGNFLIPDARVFWVRPAAAVLADLILSNGIDKVVTTGPPHSIHLIGLKLKRKFPTLKWIADFRDPWSEWDLLDTLHLTGWARRTHQKLERTVLTHADRVVTIAPYHVKRLEQLGNRSVDLITNGFDAEDFVNIRHERTAHFSIRHIGIVDALRDPRPFMKAVKEMVLEHPGMERLIRIEFVGSVNREFREEVEADGVLTAITAFVPYLPHDQLIQLYGRTDLQLLILSATALAPGNLPGKFFEYLASGKPILAVGPTRGDAAIILDQTKAGSIFERHDQAGIRQFLEQRFSDWKEGRPGPTIDNRLFTREHLTEQLIRVLESL